MRSSGQAQIVGSMILIVITIALWSMLWLWVNSTIDMYDKYIVNESKNIEESVLEKLIIEKILFKDSSTLRIFITNVGGVEVEICSIYLGKTEYDLHLVWEGRVRLNVDEGTWIDIKYRWHERTLYLIRLCTERGGVFNEFFRTP